VRAIDRTRDAGLVLLAADAYGGARRCIDMTARYTLTREQFGQPIGAFQAVKHQLADIVTDVEPALSLWWYAAHAWDHIPTGPSATRRSRRRTHRSVRPRHARLYRAHGGIGFTWEYDLHLWFRRAIFDRAYLGNAEYHRARAAEQAGW
jgi:alkylation response protein AidB-like acyl-CoA dehydrogenase